MTMLTLVLCKDYICSMLCMVEEKEHSLKNKVVDDPNVVYEVFSGDCSQHWKCCLSVLSLRLDLLVYSVFPGYFPSLGFPLKGSPVSLNSDTSSLAPNFIGKWCPFCGRVCAVSLLLCRVPI